MFCSKCGCKVKEGLTYCPNCGSKVVTPEEAANSTEAPKQETTTTNPTKKKFKKGWLWLIVIGCFLWWLFAPAKSTAPKVTISNINIRDSGWGYLEATMRVNNLTTSPIRDVEILFMAWDEAKLPVVVDDSYQGSDHPYYQDILCEAQNIPAGGTSEVSIVIWNELDKLHYVKPIVVSYTPYEGKKWNDKNTKALKEKLAGGVLKRSDVFEMERSN